MTLCIWHVMNRWPSAFFDSLTLSVNKIKHHFSSPGNSEGYHSTISTSSYEYKHTKHTLSWRGDLRQNVNMPLSSWAVPEIVLGEERALYFRPPLPQADLLPPTLQGQFSTHSSNKLCVNLHLSNNSIPRTPHGKGGCHPPTHMKVSGTALNQSTCCDFQLIFCGKTKSLIIWSCSFWREAGESGKEHFLHICTQMTISMVPYWHSSI